MVPFFGQFRTYQAVSGVVRIAGGIPLAPKNCDNQLSVKNQSKYDAKLAQKFTKLMKNAVNCPKMKSQFGLFRVNEWTNIAISQVYEVIFS